MTALIHAFEAVKNPKNPLEEGKAPNAHLLIKDWFSFRSYKMSSPTRECTFSVVFEREPIFIASRYCKFSRNLPQSPWTASVDIPKVRGNSVCFLSTSYFQTESYL